MKLGSMRPLCGAFVFEFWSMVDIQSSIISSLKACLCVFDVGDLESALCSFLGIYRDFDLFGMRMGVLLSCFTCRCQDVLKMSWEAFSERQRMWTSLVLMTVSVAWLWIRLQEQVVFWDWRERDLPEWEKVREEASLPCRCLPLRRLEVLHLDSKGPWVSWTAPCDQSIYTGTAFRLKKAAEFPDQLLHPFSLKEAVEPQDQLLYPKTLNTDVDKERSIFPGTVT